MLKIGWSKRDVSTNEPVSIPGQFYLRVSKGVFDPITVNCLVVDDGKDVVIFLSGDFEGGGSMIDDIRKKISENRPDIPASKVIFNVTHTHSGADIIKRNPAHTQIPHDGIEIYPSVEYQEFMLEKSFEAITEAYDNRKEGYIAYGYGFAVVSHHRRPTYSVDFSLRDDGNKANNSLAVDGHAKMYGPTDDDNFIGYEGGADPFANFMYTFDKDKNLTGAIINVPCPSQNSERADYLSADYWHNVREIIYEKYGEIGILPQCASAGDLAPRCLHYKKAEERRFALKYGKEEQPIQEYFRRKDIAERICVAFDEVLEWAKKDLIAEAEVSHTVKTIQLPKLMITKDQYDLAKQEVEVIKAEKVEKAEDPFSNMYNHAMHRTRINRFQSVIDRYETQQEKPFADMELHVVKIGDIAFATNPFELYMDFQHQIQARSPFTQTFIVQLTDRSEGCLGGYLATERGMQNMGYSANIYSNYVSPEGGQKLVEETLSELKKIY